MNNEELLKTTLELQAETLEVIKEVISLLQEVRTKLNNPIVVIQPSTQPNTWLNPLGYYPPYTITCGGTLPQAGNLGSANLGKLENINFGVSGSSSSISQIG